jgi:hypothetical protein
VSIAYSHATQHHFEPVRVLDNCRVHHTALLRPEEGNPAFRGARAFGKRSTSLGCSRDLRFQAEQYAWAEIKRQFGGAQAEDTKPQAADKCFSVVLCFREFGILQGTAAPLILWFVGEH